jgi:hypothetical protein
MLKAIASSINAKSTIELGLANARENVLETHTNAPASLPLRSIKLDHDRLSYRTHVAQ